VPIPISAVVLTRNEEENLPDCLASLAWADELLVVDSFSTDKTVELARSMGARVVQHPFRNFAAQRNFAQTQARHDWVLFIDADERASPALKEEIRSLANSGQLPGFSAYHIRRVLLASGRWFSDPDIVLTPAIRDSIRRHEMVRLFDRRQTTWKRALHEVAQAPEPHGVLAGAIYHFPATNLSLACAGINYYSDLEAALLHRSRTRVSLIEAIARGIRNFIYNYTVGGLYRHGAEGLQSALINGFIKFLTYAKLRERIRIQNGQGIWTEQDRKLLERFQVDDDYDDVS
jgi:glycosyltransferase involved in cell wall biosynthesis